MSSTELLDAASISMTSSEVALAIDTHDSQTPARLDRRPAARSSAGGEDLRHRRLARPARADEQVGVMDLPLLDGVAQRAHDMLLADDVGERAGAVAAVQRGPAVTDGQCSGRACGASAAARSPLCAGGPGGGRGST